MASDASTLDRYVAQGRRPLALTGTIAIHALLLLLLLAAPPLPPVAAPDPTLTAFDVVLPPPPPVDPATVPQPAVEPSDARLAPVPGTTINAGGANAARPTAVADNVPAPLAPPAPVPEPIAGEGDAGMSAKGNDSGSSTGDGAGTGSGSGAGDGGDPGGGVVRYRRAEWILPPTPVEINKFWPDRAKRERTAGQALLACQMTRPGRPDKCWTIAERPAGEGFGAAAVRMSRVFRIRPITRNGATLSTPVIIPVIFEVPPLPAKK